MEREPGTIIRDRYVLTAPFGESVEALVWRAVDMVLRRRVVVVFDPPPTADAATAIDAKTESADRDDFDINTKREAEPGDNTGGETDATVENETDDTAAIEADSDGDIEAADAGDADVESDAPVDTDADEEPRASVPAAPPLPPDVPVGALLDGGSLDDGFYRVFHTLDGDHVDRVALPAALVPGEDDTHLALPLFAGDAIDGADATNPMGFTGPLPLPVDPTTELPGTLVSQPVPTGGSTTDIEPWRPEPPAIVEPDPTKPWQPAVWALPALTAPVDAIPVRSTATRRRRRSSSPAVYRPPQHKVRRPFPVSVTAITVAGVSGLAGFLLARPAPSGSSPQLGPPPAVAEASPLVTTTVVEETTTTTVPETTTTLPPTTTRRPTTTTTPPETTPPETTPPETTPPTTIPRPTTPPRPTTTSPKPTTTVLPVFPVIPGGGRPALT